MLIIIKLIVTSAIIVLISEIAKHYDRLAALIASLPLVTLITLFWLYYEDQSDEKLASHAYYTFWYVLPTLPMFLFFPWGIKVFGFWITFILSIFLTVILFVIYAMLLKKFGIDLL
ncbi:MAG: DUF3147 family protein [Methylophilaceae bacterium]|jgi:hypothetical protein|nr:DUF3147 family protein [Methylophilaceae bacterium]MBL6726695.1 DUF3147 family protein [Methylophilaceae bacterium]MBL6728395.1 DUF3147 family protein [Methylophilaceae bacterium]MBL6791381.1 DUF3147 family protein [Methylophilaceae bacterium]